MDGKSRKLDSAKVVVNTPSSAADELVASPETQTKVDSDDPNGPRAPLRSNVDDPEEWELPCSDSESVCWDEAYRMELVACRPTIKCGTTGCTGSCPISVVGHRFSAGKKPAACGFCVKSDWVSRNVLPREQSAPLGDVEKEILLEASSGLCAQRAGSFLL